MSNMRCPVCDALKQEESHQCQVEATAVLEFRRHVTGADAPDPAANLIETVLISRKRQAQIVFQLGEHKAKAHGA